MKRCLKKSSNSIREISKSYSLYLSKIKLLRDSVVIFKPKISSLSSSV